MEPNIGTVSIGCTAGNGRRKRLQRRSALSRQLPTSATGLRVCPTSGQVHPVIKVNLTSFEGLGKDGPRPRSACVVHGHGGKLATRFCVREDHLSRSSCPRHGPLVGQVIPFWDAVRRGRVLQGLERSRNCADAACRCWPSWRRCSRADQADEVIARSAESSLYLSTDTRAHEDRR